MDLKTLKAAADELKAALAAQAIGGAAATAEKNNKQKALRVLLRRLKYCVEDNCREQRRPPGRAALRDWNNTVSRICW